MKRIRFRVFSRRLAAFVLICVHLRQKILGCCFVDATYEATSECYNQPMEPARTGLLRIMADLLRAQPAEEAVVLVWPLVCGSEVAARARAVAFAQGELTVEVADPAWRRQLASFDSRYVAGFADLLGPVVGKIRFVSRAISK